jgi:hypothetical protein
MALSAKFPVSAAIAHPLLAQLFFVEAGLPQLSTLSPSIAITALVAILAPIIIIIMAMIARTDIDASRADLEISLREG